MKLKKLYAITLSAALLISQAVTSVSAAEGEAPVSYVFNEIPEKNTTQSGISYTSYGNADYSNGTLTLTAANGGGGFVLDDEAMALTKEYPLVIEEKFTMGETAQFNAISIRGTSSTSTEVMGFYPSAPKWRILKWTKEITAEAGVSYTGRTYELRVVADIKNDTISVDTSETIGETVTSYTASASISSMYSDCTDGIKLIQMFGSKDTVIHYARLGYLAEAPEVSGDVMFGDSVYTEGTPVSRETMQITVPFSCPMDADSFENQITIQSAAGASVSANGVYDSETKSLVITNGRFKKNTEYTLKIDTGVRNSLGTAMSAPYELSFVTDASGETLSPSITISTDSAEAEEGSSISIAAQASGGESDIIRVDYYDNDYLIGTADVFPYTYTIESLQGGYHRITAVLTNGDGETAQSNALDIMAAKYLTEVVYDNNSFGETMTVTADKIKIENTITVNADTITSSFQGRIKAGDSTTSDYIYYWTIYKDLSLSAGNIKLTKGEPLTITTIIDTAAGRLDVYAGGILISGLTKTNDLLKKGIVRFDINGSDLSEVSSHYKVTKMNYAVIPSSLRFKKNGENSVYGIADADSIEIAFNKTLTEDAFTNAEITLSDADGKVINCNGEFSNGVYVLNPSAVLEGGKAYTVTVSSVEGMKETESITFNAINGFELSSCVLEADGEARARIVNNTNSSQSYVVIAVVYDGQIMRNIGFTSGTVSPAASVTPIWQVEQYIKKNGEKVTFMLWNSIDNMVPLCAAVEK